MSRTTDPDAIADRLAGHVGLVIADVRRARRWTLRELSARSGIAVASLHAIEHGRPAGLRTYAAIGAALGLDLRLDLFDPRQRAAITRAEDPVHAAMGERIAARLIGHGPTVAIDEPYQHYQFAGRADLLAWDLEQRALLHVENRTRFPNVQEAMGSYNAKRRYLPAVMADRLGVRGGWASVSNVIIGLWSSEVIHAVRIREATFRAVCPDGEAAFRSWWDGTCPPASAPTSSFVLLDPTVDLGRRRTFIGLETTLHPATPPRFRGYSDAAAALGA